MKDLKRGGVSPSKRVGQGPGLSEKEQRRKRREYEARNKLKKREKERGKPKNVPNSDGGKEAGMLEKR